MTDTPAPIEPDQVPLPLLNEAYREFLRVAEETDNDDQQALRAAIASALTAAREDIAQWISGDRSLTNAELTALIKAESDEDGDCGAIYLAYCARLVRVWPGGYRG